MYKESINIKELIELVQKCGFIQEKAEDLHDHDHDHDTAIQELMDGANL